MAADRRDSPVAWQVSLALLLAIAVATGGLHVIFDDQTWWLLVFFVLAAVLGAAATARAFSHRWFVPSAAAAATLIGLVTLLFAPGSALLAVIPTLDTVRAFGGLFGEAGASIYRQSVPANADAPIVFVLCVGVGAIALLCDVVAITLARPALAGIPLLGVLAVPAVTARDVTDLFVFALCAAAFLALLVVGGQRRQPGLAVGIGAAAIVGALTLPLVLPAVVFSAGSSPGLSTAVNPVLSLGDDLRRSAEREVLSYRTASGEPHYLRLVSLENFTGTDWAPTERDVDRSNSIAAFAPPPGLSGAVPTAEELTSIEVRNLSSGWLPVPYPPRSIEGVARDWFWESADFSVSSPNDTARGQDYVVESLIVEPTPEQLLAAGTIVPADFEQYLELPEDLPTVISETAAGIAGPAPTNYGKAIVLQEFFRSGEFTYSEDAPVDGDYDGTGMDVVATFLDVRSGYCVQFASAMAVMARSLGIPARIVVGFLPGTPTATQGDDGFTVTTDDLHSWPELYFDGIGWVQFEPTPGRGSLGDYADVSVAGVPAPVPPTAAPDAPTPAPSAPVDDAGDPGLDDSGTPVSSATQTALPRLLLALLIVAGISLLPASVRVLQRMLLTRRLLAGEATAIDAWHEVLRTAIDFRLPVSNTETPRENAAVIGASGAALARLLSAVEHEGYARATINDPGFLVSELDGFRTEARAGASTRTRLLARFYPASLWRRATRPRRTL
ncbi:transglutaminase-like putative cysteine protease [Marisediminicola sp. UYEF4]|uniref:transglutaminase family protein n=1 Tax=Marisediminicola sp. UYEF4 TaxID=1756384 RepID=UPI00339AC7A1